MSVPLPANLRRDKWALLSPDERLQALQDYENLLAADENRTACAVTVLQDSDYKSIDDHQGLRGAHRGKTISLNEGLLNSDVPYPPLYGDETQVNADEPYMAVQTLLHEDRHDHQAFIAEEAPELADNAQHLEDCEKNLGDGYLDQEKFGDAYYLAQPVEVDARATAQARTDALYADDRGYGAHRAKMEAEEAYTVKVCEGLGPHYLDKARQKAFEQHAASQEEISERPLAERECAGQSPGGALPGRETGAGEATDESEGYDYGYGY